MLAYAKLEREVEQALPAGVMDTETGKILQYRQLLRSPKFQRDWTKSSANEFGRLAKGVGGRIKNPTETIRFIHEQDVPKRDEKTSRMAASSAVSGQRKSTSPIGRDSLQAEIRSTTPARWPHQQLKCLWPKFFSTASYQRQEPGL
jgi:hypothetical protein